MVELGIRLPKGDTLEESTEYGRLAESAGVSSIWVSEGWKRNSVPTMEHLLEHTDEPDVCAGIFNIFSRTPGLIAMTARGFCDTYGERFRIGLGASAKPVVESFHGMEFESPLRRTREYIEIVNTLLAGEELDYSGRFFELSGFSLQDLDRAYEVPLYNAAMGETNLKLTGEFADGWLPHLFPVTGYDRAISILETGAEKRGRSVDDLTVAPYLPTCISDERPDEAEDHVRGLLGRYVGGMGNYYHRTVSEAGYGDAADAIQAEWQDGNYEAAKANVSADLLRDCSVCGTVDEAAESIRRFRSAGADEPVAYVPPRAPDPLIRETIQNLARIG